jgi:hypothetical protein
VIVVRWLRRKAIREVAVDHGNDCLAVSVRHAEAITPAAPWRLTDLPCQL